MLQQNFGMATGTSMDFKLAILSEPEVTSGPGNIDDHIGRSLCGHISAGKPYADMSRYDFAEIIKTHSIETYLQPIVSLSEENIVGYEALARGPLDSPIHQAADLCGTASHFGLREELEMICISKALDCALKLPDSLWISINISPDLVTSPHFHDIISSSQMKDQLHRVIIEITEHLPIPEAVRLQGVVQELEGRGIRFSLDDTGCGFADIDTAKILKAKIVKLCITVTRRIGRHPHITKDIFRIVEQVRELGGEVLGEGVERREQAEVLKKTGVIYAQGYFFGRPKPAENVLKGLDMIHDISAQ